jgi:hypothetical protein
VATSSSPPALPLPPSPSAAGAPPVETSSVEVGRLIFLTGERYLRMDRPDDAEEQFRKALHVDPGMDEARRALEKIAQDYAPPGGGGRE